MARHDTAGRRAETPPRPPANTRPEHPTAPEHPTQLGIRSWWDAIVRTGHEFREDNLPDRAAALTYYGVLSMFPGLLVLVSVIGMLGPSVTRPLIRNITAIAPGSVGHVMTSAVTGAQQSRGAAGVLMVVGLLAGLWSASGYVAAFMRAANEVYDVPEGRPVWKTLPIRLGVTILTGVLLTCAAFIVVFTGGLARQLGSVVGLGSTALTVWSIVKWPVLLLLVVVMLAVLYWAAPNARHGGWRWVSPGGLVAVCLWLFASAAFALYVANFGSYNKTYGSLGAVIIFLVWLWLSNLAILFGAEFDAELARGRAMAAGRSADTEPYMPLRDTTKLDDDT